jgi:glyoxylase-like metal-dependent hydrolase (beta-lactamase superfamily II)
VSGVLRIDRVVTSGVFELDGGIWDVDNNVWLVGDDDEVVIVDAAHDEKVITEAVGDRNVVAVVCTHGHNDHVTVAPQLGEHLHAPVVLHPADRELWELTHPGQRFWRSEDGERLAVAGTALEFLHTPGHSPGSICLYLPEAGALFTGDTLFAGGPGATGRSFSDFPTIIDSISRRLLTLPRESVVHTGHGDDTTIGAEGGNLG